jgi:tetratricopeptide (TPR) repeat protein
LQEGISNGIAAFPENKALPGHYAGCLELLSLAYQAAGQQDKAVQESEAAESFYEKALKAYPGNLKLLADAAEAAQNLSYRLSPTSAKRARDAELIARERFRLLTSLDPANADWRLGFAMSHMMECYYFESTGENEAARQALKKFDSLLQDAAQSRALLPAEADKLTQNSMDLARLAADAGDETDARAQLGIGEARFQAQYDKLPAAPFDRIQARVRWLHRKSEVVSTLGDWVELERLARESLTLIHQGLEQRPEDSELQLRRAVAQGYLGMALLKQGNAPDAEAILEQATAGFRDAPPAMMFDEDRDEYAGNASYYLALALAQTGHIERARSLIEPFIASLDSTAAKQPANQQPKRDLAQCLVLLAGMLDPAKPDQAARCQTLLNRAESILNSPDVLAHRTSADRELLAKIASVRGNAGGTKKAEIRQP